jgi:hypothetical protein
LNVSEGSKQSKEQAEMARFLFDPHAPQKRPNTANIALSSLRTCLPECVDYTGGKRFRDQIDAIVAHLYGLSRADFDHILGSFPLVFPDDEIGRRKRAALLDVYEEQSDMRLG